MMDKSTTDKDYDIISTLYHTLQGEENARVYAHDAMEEGDSETSKFFSKVEDKYKEIADEAKNLLNKNMMKHD